jgi:hypothetical protein
MFCFLRPSKAKTNQPPKLNDYIPGRKINLLKFFEKRFEYIKTFYTFVVY